MVFHFFIHKPHLLKDFENDLLDVIIFFHDVQGFVLLLISVFSLDSLHFKYIKCDFSHFDCA